MKSTCINSKINQTQCLTNRIHQLKNLNYSVLLLVMVANLLICFRPLMAQSWDLGLNHISSPMSSDFGTINNEPIKFYTHNTHWMTLNTNGSLKLNNLAGNSYRFLQADKDGNIVVWNTASQNANSILFGDGTWKPNLISVDGEKMFIPLHSKFGLGTNNPEFELDIIGDARTTNNLTVGNKLHLGGSNDYGSINYTAATGTTPAIFNFFRVLSSAGGGGGGGNTGEGGDGDPDPLPDMSCINGQINTVNAFSNLLSIRAPYHTTNVGNINIGHNGNRAFIETQGNNPYDQISHPGNLFINSQCNRNVYLFSDNGNAFAPMLNKIMSIHGRVNITDLMQIGHPTFNNFMETGSKLYIYASGVQDGIKLRHGGGATGAGFRAVELSDTDKGLSVYRGTQNNDGNEMFSVQGDGLMVLSPINNKALSIQKNNNETFSINQDGYTEFKVYSASGMPNGRVMTIKDMGAGRDLFAIKSNGKVYAREIEINLLQTFPDYVFDDQYKLTDLKSLESYILKNKHLPGFEKGEYYEKNGVNLNQLVIKQQEKIEELTLYLIQLEKRMDQVNKH